MKVGIRKREAESLDFNIEIVFNSEGDRIGKRKIKISRADQILNSRRVLKANRSNVAGSAWPALALRLSVRSRYLSSRRRSHGIGEDVCKINAQPGFKEPSQNWRLAGLRVRRFFCSQLFLRDMDFHQASSTRSTISLSSSH